MGKNISDSVEEIQRVSLKKNEYAHIEDSNTGAILVKEGPKVITLEAHQKLVEKKLKVILGSNQYCTIKNPVSKNENGNIILDEYGQAELLVGNKEVRIGPLSFALYPGEYLVDNVKNEYVLGSYDAIRVRAEQPFIDKSIDGKEKKREAGDEWLIKGPCKYIPPKDVNFISKEKAKILRDTEYCIILNPIDENGKIQEGKRKIVSGPYVFFVEPNELLEGGILKKYILDENQGILLQAISDFTDTVTDTENPINRKAGDKWVIRGPVIFTPNENVEVIKPLNVISLDQEEGIYIKDLKTGKIQLIKGPTQFMLDAHQEFYEKKLTPMAEKILSRRTRLNEEVTEFTPEGQVFTEKKEDDIERYKAVVINIEDNCAVLINNYEQNAAKVVFGPSKYILEPYEDVKVLHLSGGTPKKAKQMHIIKTRLGPDFMTDMFEITTKDHARLKIKLSYKWQFDVDENTKNPEIIFKVPDFVGYACENLSSRIRGVAAVNDFETFHQNSSRLIRESVFGVDENNKIKKYRLFSENHLKIIDIDIKLISPVDQDTADKLKEAIDTNIQIQLDASKQGAEAKAELRKIENEREMNMAKLNSDKEQEEKRAELIQLKNQNQLLESVEHAKIEAQARLEAQRLESKSEIEKAESHAQAVEINTNVELERVQKVSQAEIDKATQLSQIKINEMQQKAEIEGQLFDKKINSMGGGKVYAEVMKHMSKSGIYGNIRKMIFVPEGSKLNLMNTMDNIFAENDLIDNGEE